MSMPERPKRRKKRRATKKTAMPRWALAAAGGGALVIIVGIVFIASRGRAPTEVPVAMNPAPPANPKAPAVAAPTAPAPAAQGAEATAPAKQEAPRAANEGAAEEVTPAAPPEPPPPWTALPDPGKRPEAADVPADFGIHLDKSSGGVLFADGEGPFCLDRGQYRVSSATEGRVRGKGVKAVAAPLPRAGQEVPVIDLRIGKAGGAISAAAPLDTWSRLSPDGQRLICPGPHLRHRAIGPGVTPRPPLEVWPVGADKASALLAVPGRLRWFGFLSASEVVVNCAEAGGQQVQIVELGSGKQVRSFPLPRGAFPPLPPPNSRPSATPSDGSYGATQRAGAISGGGALLALFGTTSVELFALDDGRRLGSLPVRTFAGKELHCAGLRFSDDGKELAAVVTVRDKTRVSARLYAWSLVDGSTVVETETDHLADGPPLPGPEPETYVLALRNPDAGTRTVDGQNIDNVIYPPGGVIDRATGVVLFGLGWRPELWAAGGRLVGIGPIKHCPAEMPPSPASAAGAPEFKDKTRTEQARRKLDVETRKNRYDLLAIYAGAIDRARYAAEKQFVRDATAPRPPAAAADREGLVPTKAVAPAAWTMLPDAAAAAPPPLRDVTAPEFGGVVFSNAGQAAVIAARYTSKPRHRHEVIWQRLDQRAGTVDDQPIRLWPWYDVREEFGPRPLALVHPVAALSNGGSLALRDPASGARIDVWSPDGQRVLGFLPYLRKTRVDWTGWSQDGSVLLTLGSGKLTGWQVPAGKAIFEVDGGYLGLPVQALGAPWLAVATSAHIDLIADATGTCLGRLDAPGPITALTIAPDRRRLVTTKAEGAPIGPRVGPVGATEMIYQVCVFDLTTGRQEAPSRLAALPHNELRWCGSRLLLGTADLYDLDLRVDVCRYTLQGDFPRETPDGRVWVQLPGRLQRPALPASADNPVAGRLTTYLIPDPAEPAEAPLVRPGGLDVVFRPGTPVAVEVDFKDSSRNDKRAAALKQVLDEFGYPAGAGGWKLQMIGEEFETTDRLLRDPSDREGVKLPGVRVTARFLAPDGTEVFRHATESRFLHLQSKYYTGKDQLGVATVRHYNFGRREPRAAVADEIWEKVMAQPVRPAPVPHGVARIDGKYVLLPLRVTRKTPPE